MIGILCTARAVKPSIYGPWDRCCLERLSIRSSAEGRKEWEMTITRTRGRHASCGQPCHSLFCQLESLDHRGSGLCCCCSSLLVLLTGSLRACCHSFTAFHIKLGTAVAMAVGWVGSQPCHAVGAGNKTDLNTVTRWSRHEQGVSVQSHIYRYSCTSTAGQKSSRTRRPIVELKQTRLSTMIFSHNYTAYQEDRYSLRLDYPALIKPITRMVAIWAWIHSIKR